MGKALPTGHNDLVIRNLTAKAVTPLLHGRKDESAEELRNRTRALLKRTDSESDIDLDILNDEDPRLNGWDSDASADQLTRLDEELENLRPRERSPIRPVREREYLETDNGRDDSVQHPPAPARMAPTAAVPTRESGQSRGWYMLPGNPASPANWISRTAYLQRLQQYPNEKEVNEFLDKINSELFTRFKHRTSVPSKTFNFNVGPNGKYACCVVSSDGAKEAALDPAHFFVEWNKKRGWERQMIDYPAPKGPGPNNRDYNFHTRPTLMHYLEMRLLARTREGERWANSMGFALTSLDNRFAIGFRIWLSQDGLPPDEGRHIMSRGDLGTAAVKTIYRFRD
ncbi:MAG: hypothetical protein M1831_005151 [Alyxoria varia]|nr:MAG: hypothetical protein M1831_005151 [Alyxoria varia]